MRMFEDDVVLVSLGSGQIELHSLPTGRTGQRWQFRVVGFESGAEDTVRTRNEFIKRGAHDFAINVKMQDEFWTLHQLLAILSRSFRFHCVDLDIADSEEILEQCLERLPDTRNIQIYSDKRDSLLLADKLTGHRVGTLHLYPTSITFTPEFLNSAAI